MHHAAWITRLIKRLIKRLFKRLLIGCNQTRRGRGRSTNSQRNTLHTFCACRSDRYNAEPGGSLLTLAAAVHTPRHGSALAAEAARFFFFFFFFFFASDSALRKWAARALSEGYFRTCPGRIAVAGIEAAPEGQRELFST